MGNPLWLPHVRLTFYDFSVLTLGNHKGLPIQYPEMISQNRSRNHFSTHIYNV